MLGWEFPPAIYGGLGIACRGLARALAPSVDLEVIVPSGEAPSEGYRVRAVDSLHEEDFAEVPEPLRYESFSRVHRIPVDLDPYESEGRTILEDFVLKKGDWSRFAEIGNAQLEMFRRGSLYGRDLGLKVVEFSKIVARLVRGREFDLIHAHDWMTFLAGVEIKKATGKPLLVHVHSSQYDRSGEDARGWIYDLERYGMSEADAVIPVSRYTGRILASHYGIRAEKIYPIHNGVDPVEAFTTDKKFPEKLVLFLGRLTPQKGAEYFLEIASRVLEANPDVRFAVAGTGERLKRLIESGAYRGMGGKFHFTGFLDRERVHRLLSMTDVYCMPSVSEPFGLSALEAAQFRIPAVISKQSGVSEVLKGALKADHWDTHLMARHINALLKNETLRKEVVQESEADLRNCTWEASASRVLDVYQALLSEP